MKSNTFNVSLLAIGVAAVMGISTGANAATPTGGANEGSFAVLNKAEATYTVGNNSTQQRAFSNEVKITVNETSSFSLVNDNANIPINPQANSTATFTHTLKNEVTDDANVSSIATLVILVPLVIENVFVASIL